MNNRIRHLGNYTILVLLLALLTSDVSGQDVLVVKSKNNKSSKRRGTIVEWTGTSISFESKGRTKEYDSTMVTKIETAWPETYTTGLGFLKERKYSDAIASLQLAKRSENRAWAKRTISGKLVECYLATQNEPVAVGEFLSIIKTDPQTRFFHLIPLPWVDSGTQQSFAEQTASLMNSDGLTEQLIGAAWALSTRHRADAIAKLDELSRDINPRIAALATAQGWRTKSISANVRDIDRWTRTVKSMPPELRAGAYWLLADAQSRNDQTDTASINLMRIPILFPEQHGLAAAALYRCANLRKGAKRTDEYKSLLNEITLGYSDTIWAGQATAQLNQLNKN